MACKQKLAGCSWRYILWIMVCVTFYTSSLIDFGCTVYLRFFMNFDNIFGSHTDVHTLELTNREAFLSDVHDLFVSQALNIVTCISLHVDVSAALMLGVVNLSLDCSTFLGQMRPAQSVLFHMQVVVPLQGLGIVESWDFAWWGLSNWWSGLAYWVIFKESFNMLLYGVVFRHTARAYHDKCKQDSRSRLALMTGHNDPEEGQEWEEEDREEERDMEGPVGISANSGSERHYSFRSCLESLNSQGAQSSLSCYSSLPVSASPHAAVTITIEGPLQEEV